jgi:hypothetical protein
MSKPRIQTGFPKRSSIADLGGWDGQEFDCATWLRKAREQRKNNFGGRAEGAERERNRSVGACLLQVVQERDSVIEQAIQMAAFMLDSDKIARLLPGDDLRGLSRWS